VIVVKLIGGLGNQMFQYAIGRRLALKNNCRLYLDINHLKNTNNPLFTNREFQLNTFKTESNIVPNKILKKIYYPPKKIFSFFSSQVKIIKEEDQSYHEEIIKNNKNIYLDGYWQTELYFMEIRKTLLKEFTPKDPLDEDNLKEIELINKTNSISVHVRRGDYVNNPLFSELLGTCNVEYYKNAFEIITTKISDPSYYIFSDDIEWAKSNLLFLSDKMRFININFWENSYKDLVLMNKCKHNIIANSSFSWWGAWLNNNPNKIVIAPKKWFNDESIRNKDLIPNNWIKI
jgi:hypothetical protein